MLFLYVAQLNEETRELFTEFYDEAYTDIQTSLKLHFPNFLHDLHDDCEQEVWIQCSKSFESILKLNGIERKKYVLGIARNTIIDFVNRECLLRNHSAELDETIQNVTEDSESLLEFLSEETEVDILEALRKLPDNMRYTLEQRYLRCMSVEEISEHTGVSTAAIYKRIERGLVELKAILQKQGGYAE